MISIAILGYGVVGSGVAKVIADNGDRIAKCIGDKVDVKYILDLLDFPGDVNEKKVIHDFNIILNDPQVSIVVETMGGKRKAYEFTGRALNAGKSVVTSNKELVATYGDELSRIADEKGVRYMFEASVGGGIPIITPICDSLAANEITEICGIVNGTSNYILTAMKNGQTFGEALSEAQAKGYAEANPDADVKGIDACRKICILAALAFGVLFDPDSVPTTGIDCITTADIEAAAAENAVIKLIARAVRLGDGRVSLSVEPFKVRRDNPLANIEGVYNGILVRGNEVGEVMFYGPGAGSLPTASAVVADVMHIAEHIGAQHKQQQWMRNPALLAAMTDSSDIAASEKTLGIPLYQPVALK